MATSKSYKADFGSRIVFIFVFGFLFILCIINFVIGKQLYIGSWVFSFGLMMLPQIWLSSQSLILSNSRLEKINWFIIHREIDLSKVVNAAFVVGPLRRNTELFKLEGMVRLELKDNDKYKWDPFTINIKVFTRSALYDISQAIIDSAKDAKIDPHIIKFANRKYVLYDGVNWRIIWNIFMVTFFIFFVIALFKTLLFHGK
jgi:hypothetical protein